MKARLAVLVVALVLAIAGAFGATPARATLTAAPPFTTELPTMQVDPGGWWDWH
jgi:hypothetical protein